MIGTERGAVSRIPAAWMSTPTHANHVRLTLWAVARNGMLTTRRATLEGEA